MTGLIPTTSGRPAVVTRKGVVTYVSIHDRWYMAERKRLRQAMSDAHPDRGGSREAFDRALAAWGVFGTQEQAWYQNVGLLPPVGGAVRMTATRRAQTALHTQVWDLVRQGDRVTITQIARRLEVSVPKVRGACNALIAAGQVQETSERQGQLHQRWLTPTAGADGAV